MITYAKLLESKQDICGYTTYVFKSLEENPPFGKKYIMCTRFPNWQDKEVNIGDIGYLNTKEVIAGVDKWFDGETFHPYNYSNIIYEKFVKESNVKDNELIL
jgi:hypothetical protein